MANERKDETDRIFMICYEAPFFLPIVFTNGFLTLQLENRVRRNSAIF